jgi:hypothetical protein
MIRTRRFLTVLLTGMIVTVSTGMVAGSRVWAQQDALEPLVLYDDFNAPLINPDKWFGSENGPRSQLGDVPNPFGTEACRDIVKDDRAHHGGPSNRQLRLSYRAYGNQNSDSGRTGSGPRLRVPNPAAVTALAATLTVKQAEVAACATNPAATETRARIFGFFFNTDTPTPGSPVNDVLAWIGIRARSDVAELHVVALVFQCADLNCRVGSTLGFADLGPVDENTPVRLLMQWDQAHHQFLFQRDDEDLVLLPYMVPDTSPLGLTRKSLDLDFEVPNCTTEPRPVAFIEARFDDVFVNQSAAPTP